MIQNYLFAVLLFVCGHAYCQKAENLIVITTDGLRWQEVFTGMDSAIANNKAFNEGDSNYIFGHYWSNDVPERRKKLMPFLWSTIASNGQLYGNRNENCKVDNANPYWFSYPGYSEIFTGYVDSNINSNSYPPNPNTNVLEFIHQQKGYKGKVAAFGAWEAFNRILNEERSGFPVIAAFDTTPVVNSSQRLINQMLKDAYKPWNEDECFDVFTHHAAMEYWKAKQPRVLYIAYGETDEWAHAGKYRSYLDAAHQLDQWLRDIWNTVQANPQYKNKTAILMTTDHGRGDIIKRQWRDHGSSVSDAHEIWLAVMAPGVPAKGEVKKDMQLYQKQIAQTIASLLGLTFTAAHPVAEKINLQ